MQNHIAFPQVAPRRTYRDIPGQYDRMGQFLPAFPFQGVQYATAADGSVTQADASMAGCVPEYSCPTQKLAPFCGAFQCCPVPKATTAYPRVVGFPRVCIGPCECETIDTSVCGPFTLIDMYISPKIAHDLSITAFQVGCSNLMVSCDPIPAEVFACCENFGESALISTQTVEANTPICLTVENEGSKEKEFKGALYGLLCLACP